MKHTIQRDGNYVTVSGTCIITGTQTSVKYPAHEYAKFMMNQENNLDPVDKLFLTKGISPAGYKLTVPKNEEYYYGNKL